MFQSVIGKFVLLLSIFSCVLTTIIGLQNNWPAVVAASVVTLLGIIIVWGIVKFTKWRKSQLKVELHPDWIDAPPKYRTIDTLEYLTKNKNLQLEIIGRTCFRWLCGNEKDFVDTNAKSTRPQESQIVRQQLIRQAVKQGNSIHFILQNPNISIPYFTTEDNSLIYKHAQAAIKSYNKIAESLSPSEQRRLQLSLTEKLVENSMVRLKSPKITRIIFDFNINFKSSRTPAEKVSTPFLVFEYGTSTVAKVVKLFNSKFDDLKSGHISLEEDEKQTKEGLEEVDRLIAQYHCHSNLRQDTSKNLAIVSARHFLAERQPYLVGNTPPPVSIHLLITNDCSTVCKMCDHYKLSSYNKPTHEWKDIFDEINKLGTKSVIISGGEPLMREDLFELLKYGKKNELNIGLITNGVKKNGAPLEQEEAEIISRTCSWVQVSIDSFKKYTYEKIRGRPYLEHALESLRTIAQWNPRKVEICFTIQKDNIDEVPSSCQAIPNDIPQEVPIRYKFAHGPTNGQDFLCTEDQINNLFEGLRAIRADCEENDCHRCNIRYLISMYRNYFDAEDLSKGTPLKKTMIGYKALHYTCRVLHLTCTIDANGNVYPCCFLFDDNHAKSTTRAFSQLNLKTPQQLSTIWHDNAKLKEFRNMILPITLHGTSETACNYCTRHFYQNEFLNKLNRIFTTHSGVAEKFIEKNEEIPAFFL